MINRSSIFSKFMLGLVVGSALSFITAGVVVKAIMRRNAPKPQPLLKQGFDFRSVRSGDYSWKGPAIGEKIDLTMLKARDGSPMAQLVGKQLIMLASINPACRMCKIGKDQLFFIRNKIAPLGIKYYPVCFDPVESHNFFDYSNSIGLTEPAFEWRGVNRPSRSLLDMNIPSHLLVDHNGTVLGVWPGSYAEQEVRQRMGSQIVEDTLIINETLQTVSHDSKD